jgi:hypothetical protein
MARFYSNDFLFDKDGADNGDDEEGDNSDGKKSGSGSDGKDEDTHLADT